MVIASNFPKGNFKCGDISRENCLFSLCIFFFLNLNVEENNLGPKIIAVSL